MRVWLLPALLAMAGCATEPAIVTVQVPVPVYCEPAPVSRPAMPADALDESADVFVVGRALWAELEVREAYEERLRDAVDQCRKTADEKKERPP